MKVKIGDEWYSTDDQFISVQLTDEELDIVKGMSRENSPNLRFTSGHAQTGEELIDWARS